jgi:hypothetical protein
MKTHIAMTAVCLAFCCLKSAAQFTNKGAQITITSGGLLYTRLGLQNSSGASITNNGTVISDSFVTNNSGCTISGNGIYNVQGNWKNSGTFLPDTSKIIFFGKGNSDITSGGADVYDLRLNKNTNGILNLKGALKVLDNIRFLVTKNWVQLNKNILTLDANCTVSGYNDKNFFITNDSGFLKKMSVNPSKFTFPVGFSKSGYNPLSIAEAANVDNYSVRCLQHALLNGGSGTALTQGGIDVSWLIKEAVPGGANATIEAQWYPSRGDELPGFDSSKCMVVRYKSTGWDFSAAQAGPASGTTAKTKKRSGVTAFGYFTVLSTATPTLQNSITAVNDDNFIHHNAISVQILVYPTVVQNNVNISVMKNGENIQTMNVTVMDGSGKTVWQRQKIKFQSQQLSLPHLSSGVYMMLIEYGANSYNQKIIVSR